MAGLRYPDARRLDIAEEISGHVVRDPYRWLEDPGSAETRAWLAGQDALFTGYAAALPGRDALAARIGELMRAGSVGPPAWRGGRRFFLRRTADQDHAVLFTVFDSDTRVDPMHARKMCAALQHAVTTAPGGLDGPGPPGRAGPILFRRELSAGHGARAVSRSVSQSADTLAFAAFHTRHPGIRR